MPTTKERRLAFWEKVLNDGADGEQLEKLSANTGQVEWGTDGGGPGGLSDGDYGDVIVSGGGTVMMLDSGVAEPAGAVATHAAAADPHTGYQKESEKGAANGYASLGAGGLVPVAQLASGTPDGTKFVRDDGTLATPAGGSGLTHPQVMARSWF